MLTFHIAAVLSNDEQKREDKKALFPACKVKGIIWGSQ
jgi:hypothetical protein